MALQFWPIFSKFEKFKWERLAMTFHLNFTNKNYRSRRVLFIIYCLKKIIGEPCLRKAPKTGIKKTIQVIGNFYWNLNLNFLRLAISFIDTAQAYLQIKLLQLFYYNNRGTKGIDIVLFSEGIGCIILGKFIVIILTFLFIIQQKTKITGYDLEKWWKLESLI